MSIAITPRKPRRAKRGPIPEVPAALEAQFFTIARWGTGYAVTTQWRGHPLETIICSTPGEANRLRQVLSDQGLIGFVPRGLLW